MMDVELSDLPLTDYVFEHAHRWPDRPALIDGLTGVALTYRELIGAVRRGAAGFAAHGLAKGDVVALCSPNRPEFVIEARDRRRFGRSTAEFGRPLDGHHAGTVRTEGP